MEMSIIFICRMTVYRRNRARINSIFYSSLPCYTYYAYANNGSVTSINLDRDNAISGTQWTDAPAPDSPYETQHYRITMQCNGIPNRDRRGLPACDQLSERRIDVPSPCADSVKQADLTWILADAAKPFLNTAERNRVYVIVGVGEPFAAFGALVALIASRRIVLPADLVQQCIDLLDAYLGHEEEPRLRRLIERTLDHRPTPTTTCVNHFSPVDL